MIGSSSYLLLAFNNVKLDSYIKGLENKYSLRGVDANGARRIVMIKDYENLLGLIKVLSIDGTTSLNDF